ncbi:iron ABC transporter permease [Acidianus brierleyi]|uniref:Iron ABC transporter n=1 Tax=Acidianus brierleyi TaxID=41673 RepID=A0A2U9IDR5_9CREN|nr:iron ABC transporter permease [Acidianus brierleyi]AWR94172.1 iron chelate uptake ABC transporter family permease subunit [Acidianus brierleyi]
MKLKIMFFVLILMLSFLLSLIYGSVKIPIQDIFRPEGVYKIIFLEIRLPTVISAAIIGAVLSISGAIMQLLLRNPLLDPYISGTASGGAFGAVLSYFLLAFNLPFSWIIYVSPVIAFVFALFSTFLTIAIGRKGGVYGIVIGGVVISYIFSSLITILLTFMEIRYPQVPPLVFWLLGDIQVIGWNYVIILALLSFSIIFLAIKFSRKIDLASISDEMAYSSGLNPSKFRIFWISIISIITGYIVSQVGIIGFIGIIVPHIVRRFFSGSSTQLIPFSALLGSSVLLLSNLVADGSLGFKIPITAITSLIASPIIIYVLVKGIANQGT